MKYAGDDDADGAAGAHKLGNIANVEIICAEVMVGVETDDSIEEIAGKRQRVRLRVNGENLLLCIGGADTLPVVAGADRRGRPGLPE